jgi:hypothetical protein
VKSPRKRSSSSLFSTRFAVAAVGTVLSLTPVAVSAGTVAHYRFENGIPETAIRSASNGVVLDTSGNGHHLHPANNPTYRTTVPAPVVPLTRTPNKISAHFTGTEDIYAMPGDPLCRTVFSHFTIETYVRFDSISGWQTLVGRDDANEGTGPYSLFYLSKVADRRPGPGQTANAFRVEVISKDNTMLTIESSSVAVADTWYHVAAVGDATAGTLSLYVNGSLVGSTTGFTGLFAPRRNTGWTLGRGQFKNRPADNLIGSLDEVRFSDVALTPSQFLNAPTPARKLLRKRFWRAHSF